MTAVIGSLRADLTAGIAAFQKGMKQASKSVSTFGRQFGKAAAKVGKSSSIMAKTIAIPTAVIGGYAALSAQASKTADQIAKTADRLGVTTTTLQEFRFAAARAGVGMQTADMGLQRLMRRAGDAARGIGEAEKTFEELGVAVENSNGTQREAEEIINDVSDAIAGMSSEQQRLSATVKLVDSEAAGLVEVFKKGSAELDRTRAAAQRLGVVIREDLIRNGEGAENAMGDLGLVLRTNLNTILLESAPLIAEVATKLAEATPKIRKFFEELFGLGKSGAEAKFKQFFEETTQQVEGLIQVIEESRKRLNTAEAGLTSSSQATRDQSAAIITAEREKIATTLAEIQRLHDQIRAKRQEIDERFAPRQSSASSASSANSGGSNTAEDEKAVEKRQKVIDDLRFEGEQLGRTAEQQAIYNNLRRAGIDLGDAFVDKQGAIIGATRQEAEAIAELTLAKMEHEKAQEEYNAMLEEQKEALEDLKTPQDRYEERVQRLDDLLKNKMITLEEYQKLVAKAGEEMEKANEKAGFLKDGIRRVGRAFDDGKISIQEWWSLAIDALGSFLEKMIETASTASSLGGGGGPGGFGGGAGGGGFAGVFGGIGGVISNFFSGFFAKGGVIPRGTFGIAGERGPEPVFAGRTSLSVLPNSALGGGGSTVVLGDINVNVQAPQGGTSSPVDQRSFGLTIGRAVREVVHNEITEMTRPGGLLNPQGVRSRAV